ncbi:MAG: hypothetical protein GX287_01455 [Fusobacteria bacterium]|nr:hypothetical protein [Fusobacteriota bacterium]
MKDFKIKFFNSENINWSIEDIKEVITRDGEVLKNDERSFVKKMEIKNKKIIYKVPNQKNNSKRTRFLSLFRKSQVEVVLESMEILNKNRIYTNQPIVFGEKRKFGMVIDSFMIYEYIKGIEIT